MRGTQLHVSKFPLKTGTLKAVTCTVSLAMVGWSSPVAEFPAAAGLDAGRLSGCAVVVLVSVVGCSTLGVGVGFALGTRGKCGICAEVICKLKSAPIKNAKVSNAKV